MYTHCKRCGKPLPADARPDQVFCKSSHRTAWANARLKRARELLLEQTRAIIAGDQERLDAIVAEANELFREELRP